MQCDFSSDSNGIEIIRCDLHSDVLINIKIILYLVRVELICVQLDKNVTFHTVIIYIYKECVIRNNFI